MRYLLANRSPRLFKERLFRNNCPFNTALVWLHCSARRTEKKRLCAHLLFLSLSNRSGFFMTDRSSFFFFFFCPDVYRPKTVAGRRFLMSFFCWTGIPYSESSAREFLLHLRVWHMLYCLSGNSDSEIQYNITALTGKFSIFFRGIIAIISKSSWKVRQIWWFLLGSNNYSLCLVIKLYRLLKRYFNRLTKTMNSCIYKWDFYQVQIFCLVSKYIIIKGRS